MHSFEPPFEYKQETTGDGSPTLRLPPTWEPMHALEGAFSETQYIYGPTVAQALAATSEPRILSVGLGLGYNEILCVCESLRQERDVFFIDSYESVRALRDQFAAWSRGEDCDLAGVYDAILSLYVKSYGLTEERVRERLNQALSSGALTLHPAMGPGTQFSPSHGILFDAFSHKSSPELWTEEFLEIFLKMAAGTPCFLSTYASKGTLHRALKQHGFASEKRDGYGKKRESTFAAKL